MRDGTAIRALNRPPSFILHPKWRLLASGCQHRLENDGQTSANTRLQRRRTAQVGCASVGNVGWDLRARCIARFSGQIDGGAVSLALKVLHFEGCKPLVESGFYEAEFKRHRLPAEVIGHAV